MAVLKRTDGELEFRGSLDSDDDLAASATAAAACGAYRRDDEDEDPLERGAELLRLPLPALGARRVHVHEGPARAGHLTVLRPAGRAAAGSPAQSARPVASQSRYSPA